MKSKKGINKNLILISKYKPMEGLTLTLGQRDGKIVVEYGFKGYSNINLDKIPNILNLRDLAKSFLIKETITTKFSDFISKLKTKIPFFKKGQNQTNDNMRVYRSVNIPFTKERIETKQIETIS